MIWSDFEFVIHLACIIKPRILDIIWPCLLIIMIMTWLFSGILFICARVVSFAARARSVWCATEIITSHLKVNCLFRRKIRERAKYTRRARLEWHVQFSVLPASLARARGFRPLSLIPSRLIRCDWLTCCWVVDKVHKTCCLHQK